MVQLGRYFFFLKMPKIWVGQTTLNGEKKEDGRSIEKGYRLLSYASPQRKYFTPYGKILFQIF